MSLFFLFLMIKLLPRSTPFPYTTLFRSVGFVGGFAHEGVAGVPGCSGVAMASHRIRRADIQCSEGSRNMRRSLDRKSTRLNSSHLGSSYAVFCFKKQIFVEETAASDTVD